MFSNKKSVFFGGETDITVLKRQNLNNGDLGLNFVDVCVRESLVHLIE